MIKLILLALFLLLSGCLKDPQKDDDLKIKKTLEKLTVYLSEIKSPSDFKNKRLQLRNEFIELSKLLIDMKLHSSSGPAIKVGMFIEQSQRFDQEFLRVMKIDGCKELYEEASLDALYMLDSFERKLRNPAFHKIKSKKIEED